MVGCLRCVLQFWSHIMSTRFTRARALIASSSNPIKHVTSAVNFRKVRSTLKIERRTSQSKITYDLDLWLLFPTFFVLCYFD